MKNKTKKLILLKSYGQHSNRLIQNLHFEAFCLEHRIEYLNPTFKEDFLYLNPCSTKTSFYVKFLLTNILVGIGLFKRSKTVKKIFSLYWLFSKVRIIKYIDYEDEKMYTNCEKKLLNAFETRKVVFVGGWCFKVPKLIEKHRNALINKYSLNPIYFENNNFYQKFIKLKKPENILIGIHIRRGDYKEWQQGKYYFEDDVYLNYINSLSQKISRETEKKQIFIIFSNETVNFKEKENLLISKEDWYIDHLIMSHCDYLLGTRSTFSLWASYLGNNTFYCIRDRSGNIENTITDFYENDLAHILGEYEAKKVSKIVVSSE